MPTFNHESRRDLAVRATEDAARREAAIAEREVARQADGLEPGEIARISALREIGPLAAVSFIAVLVVTIALNNDAAIGRWLLAAVLFAHGWVHLMFLFPHPPASPGKPDSWPFDLRTSWLVRRAGVAPGVVHGLGRALALATFVLSILAALATAGLLVPAAWWPGLLVAAAVASLVLLGVGFRQTLLIGVGVDAWMLLLALAGSWRPG